MKHTVRSFSIGLLIAGLIMLAVFYIAEDTGADQAEISVDEMIAGLESEGYRVVTESEYISYTLADGQQENEDESQDELASEEDTDEDENAEEENESTSEEKEQVEESDLEENGQEETEEDNTPNTITINIEPGTPSLDISYMLEERNLIDDAIEFNDYVQVNGYALRIQLGEHELHENMSYYEIAEALTN